MTGSTVVGNVRSKMHNLEFVFLQIPPEIHDENYNQQVHVPIRKFTVTLWLVIPVVLIKT